MDPFGVVLTAFLIAEADDALAQLDSGFIEDLGLAGEVLSQDGDLEIDALGRQPVEGLEEALGILVVFPAVIPEDA